MIDLTTVEQIKRLGFSEYEAKCYLALLERESLSVSDISRLAGIPRTNTYEAMDRLLVKGLCVSLPGKIKRFSASDPSLIKEKFITTFNATKQAELEYIENKQKEISEQRDKELQDLEKRRQEILEKEKDINMVIENVDEKLSSIFTEGRGNGDPLDYLEVLKNPMQIHNKFLKLISKTQKEILGFSKPPYAAETKAQRREELRVQAEAIKRGVVVKAIIQMPSENNALDYFVKVQRGIEDIKENINYPDTKSFDEFPMKAKIVDELPIKLFVFDEKACFFTLEDPIKNETSLTMLVAEHKAMAKSFRFLFESFWDKARDYYVANNKKYYLYDFKG